MVVTRLPCGPPNPLIPLMALSERRSRPYAFLMGDAPQSPSGRVRSGKYEACGIAIRTSLAVSMERGGTIEEAVTQLFGLIRHLCLRDMVIRERVLCRVALTRQVC